MEPLPHSQLEPYEGAFLEQPCLPGSLVPGIEEVANKTVAITMLVGITSNFQAMGHIRTIAAFGLDTQNFKGSYQGLSLHTMAHMNTAS